MKKVIVLLAVLMLVMAGAVLAADGDIDQAEVRPDVVGWQLDTVRFLVVTKTCEVVYRRVDADSKPIDGVQILFMDIEDNPETPEDETLTDFSQLITAINNGSNIKQTIANAVKIKLGIE